MNNIRAKFEEIWPVPDVIYWRDYHGYTPINGWGRAAIDFALEYNARLDTFTRCQETMAPVMSIIDEMIADIEYLNDEAYGSMQCPSQELIYRAKQIMEQKK